MPDRFEKANFPLGRCNPCEYARVVPPQGNGSFLGAIVSRIVGGYQKSRIAPKRKRRADHECET